MWCAGKRSASNWNYGHGRGNRGGRGAKPSSPLWSNLFGCLRKLKSWPRPCATTIASAFVVAEGTCSNPAVAPGKQVEIDGVGARFKGTYYVTQVIHQWVKDKGLTTQIAAKRPTPTGASGVCSKKASARR